MFEQINATHRPVIVTQNGEARAILQDPESYEQLKSALGIMKLISQGEEDVRKNRVVKQEKLFSQINKKSKQELHS